MNSCNSTWLIDHCNRSVEDPQSVQQLFRITALVGYALMCLLCIPGLFVNCFLTSTLVQMRRAGQLTWKHYPLILCTVVFDLVGCCLVVVDSVLHIGYSDSGPDYFLIKTPQLLPLSMGTFVWSFIVPTHGYAIIGLFTTIAVWRPLWYKRHVTFDVTRIATVTYAATCLLIFGVFVVLSAMAEDGIVSLQVKIGYFIIISIYVYDLILFSAFNVVITVEVFKVRRQSYKRKAHNQAKNCDTLSVNSHRSRDSYMTVAVHMAQSFRFHIAFHTLAGACFIVLHAICLSAIVGAHQTSGSDWSCASCAALLAVKRRQRFNQLAVWFFQVLWTTRYVIEPCVMLLYQKDVKRFVGIGSFREIPSAMFSTFRETVRTEVTVVRL